MGTWHTLPTASCKKKYGCYLLFSPAHTAHTAHSILSFLKEKIWMLSIFLACTHRTHYSQHLARRNMDATYYFHLHTLHTLHTLPTLVQTTHYDRNICVYYFHLHTSHTPHTLPTAS